MFYSLLMNTKKALNFCLHLESKYFLKIHKPLRRKRISIQVLWRWLCQRFWWQTIYIQ